MRIFIITFAIAFLLGSCSKIDNYGEGNATVKGGIYDIATKGANEELIPAQSPDGARVRLFEEGSSQPVNFWCETDGTFNNNRIFSARYKIIPEGPFITKSTDTLSVSIPNNAAIAFYVEPYLRIKSEATRNGNNVDVKFKISKSSQWTETLNQYVILYSWTKHLDASNYISREIVNVSASEENSILESELTKTIAIPEANANKPVFVRVAARTTGTSYYNYSSLIQLK